jgi:hypothetical protein
MGLGGISIWQLLILLLIIVMVFVLHRVGARSGPCRRPDCKIISCVGFRYAEWA